MNAPQSWKVVRAEPEESSSARSLLSGSDLPTQGLDETELWCVRDGAGRVLGIAGLETWGEQGLLRSVVVEEDHRRDGVGSALVERIIKEANARGLAELYLITETAPLFFQRFGFNSFDRKNVVGPVLGSIEFKEACAETAPVMRLALR
jgi:amino-acid N-acetyltransferase